MRQMLDQLITSGVCANEVEAIERALRMLVTAVTLEPAGGGRGAGSRDPAGRKIGAVEGLKGA